MKIDNKTHWRSEDVEALVRRIAKDEWDFTLVKTRINIRYRRNGTNKLGHCYYGRVSMQLNLPRVGPVDVVQVAHTIAHEFAHARGLRHNEMHMPAGRYDYATGWRDYYAWAAGWSIREQEAKPQLSPVAVVDTKVIQIEKRIAQWQSKARRAATAIKKYNRRLRYLQGRKAALSGEGQ